MYLGMNVQLYLCIHTHTHGALKRRVCLCVGVADFLWWKICTTTAPRVTILSVFLGLYIFRAPTNSLVLDIRTVSFVTQQSLVVTWTHSLLSGSEIAAIREDKIHTGRTRWLEHVGAEVIRKSQWRCIACCCQRENRMSFFFKSLAVNVKK